jgi:hypothetical protein
MTLTKAELITLANGIRSLSATNPQNGQPIHKFGGKTSYAIAKNLRKIKPSLDELEEARTHLLGSSNGDFQAEWAKLIKEVVEIDIHKIKLGELNPETNNITPEVYHFLDAMIIEE